eukprot:g104.t1
MSNSYNQDDNAISLSSTGALKLAVHGGLAGEHVTDTVHNPQPIRNETENKKEHAYYHPDYWFHHLFSCYGSVIPTIAPRVLVFTIWATAVRFLEIYADWQPDISTSTHATAGTALGLLLVFRTNSAYDRFWEGRKKWGMIINRTRDISRQAITWMKDKGNLWHTVIRHTIAFAYASRSHLRASRDIRDVEDILTQGEFDYLSAADHIPMRATVVISSCIVEAHRKKILDPYAAQSMDANLTSLLDQLGACERIKKTPIPFSYVMHTRRFITIYLLTLPFALSDLEWYMVPAVAGLAYAFLGIEAIAIEIEDPFAYGLNDLPLGDLCDTIRRNLREVLLDVAGGNSSASKKGGLTAVFEPPPATKNDVVESKKDDPVLPNPSSTISFEAKSKIAADRKVGHGGRTL